VRDKAKHKRASQRWYEEHPGYKAAANKKFRQKYPERYAAINRKCLYGITKEEYDQLLVSQKNCCALCGKHQLTMKRRLHVDHNHRTGKVRGLLCGACNIGLIGFETMDWKVVKKYLKE
jgi:hypothetical protein